MLAMLQSVIANTNGAKPMTISISAGRDYNSYSCYEFCVFENEEIVARQGGFRTNTAAKRAGLKAAQSYADRVPSDPNEMDDFNSVSSRHHY